MPQTLRVCLREAAATAGREYKEFQKRYLFFICCILCLFSQKFATLARQFHHHPGWQQARTPQGGVSVSSRHCLPTIVTPCQETLSTNSNIELVQNILSRKFYDGWICQLWLLDKLAPSCLLVAGRGRATLPTSTLTPLSRMRVNPPTTTLSTLSRRWLLANANCFKSAWENIVFLFCYCYWHNFC